MARVGVADLAGDFVDFELFGIEEHTGVVEFMVEQIPENGVAVNFFEARL